MELLVEALKAIVAKEPAVQKFDAQLLADGFVDFPHRKRILESKSERLLIRLLRKPQDRRQHD